jgi:hypothetical protein
MGVFPPKTTWGINPSMSTTDINHQESTKTMCGERYINAADLADDPTPCNTM